MPTIRVNDINIYYEIHGDGEPLLLIAGLASDISENEGMVRQLARKYKVIAFDNRGAGRTDKPDIPYSIEMMADDTAELLTALSIERAHVLGISLGGRIALELALQHPQMVKTLVLVSTAARVISTWRRRLLFGTLPRLPLFKGRYPQPYYAFVRQREASSSYDCTDRLFELHVPAVIMHGKKDRSAPYKLAEELHNGIAGSRMIEFNGGHLFLFFRQKQFLDAVFDFLESQMGEPSSGD